MSAKQKCKKVSNPCKICLGSVNTKTGIQCHGACEAWVHFECLNFTPGKIKDVLGGYITITCPCPDCKTSVPKEHVTDEAYTCNNMTCPANNPPACEEFTCQANELSRSMPPKCPPPGTLRSCNPHLCRDYSGPNAYKSRPNECMEGYTLKTSNDDKERMRILMPDGQIVCETPPCPQDKKNMVTAGTQVQNILVPKSAQQGPIFSPTAVQQMCRTVGDLAQQLNNLMDSLKGMGGTGGGVVAQQGITPCGSSGVGCEGKADCGKCGQGRGAGKKAGCTGGCGQAGSPGCAQPCHCPGNPLKKYR